MVSQVARDQALGSRHDLLHHARILNEVAASAPVLPARLVSDDDTARFSRAVAELEAGRPALRIEMSGPWPPYCAVADPPGAG
ncbi:hypothetical protein KRM28CT15_41060 [Krasilnikovia sp. M28-CT-15]